MISIFPEPYPDELVYSLLARYYAYAGYLGYRYAAEDLYTNVAVHPDVEFLNPFSTDAVEAITRNRSMESLIAEHTMFPYYARFLQLERRQRAFQTLLQMRSGIRNDLLIPKHSGDTRYLRYCPVCTSEDRQAYGETYWHRAHQMQGVDVCPYHGCYLIHGAVPIDSHSTPALVPAEEEVPDAYTNIVHCQELELRLAQYANAVFQTEVDMTSNVAIGTFLHTRMEGTKYLSVRGEQRYMRLIHHDYTLYYKDFSKGYKELWELQKVFTNDKRCTFDVCLLAMFLDIAIEDLTHMVLPKKSQQQRFDERVHELHRQGLKYPAIAEQMHASINIVKAIGERRYGAECRAPKDSGDPLPSGVKPRDWNKQDRYMLPQVRDAIQQLQGDGTTRPKKVSMLAVARLLHLQGQHLYNMPLCKSEIMRCKESQPEYWARETVWAAKLLISLEEPFNWKHLRELTNMRRQYLQACIPYLGQYTEDNELIASIEALLV